MLKGAIFTFGDPYSYQQAIRAAEVEIVVTTRGEFRAELRQIDLHRLWMQGSRESLPRIFRSAVSVKQVPIFFLAGANQAGIRHTGIRVVLAFCRIVLIGLIAALASGAGWVGHQVPRPVLIRGQEGPGPPCRADSTHAILMTSPEQSPDTVVFSAANDSMDLGHATVPDVDVGSSGGKSGSESGFGDPGLWKEYRWQVVAFCGVVVLQAAMLAGLLVERRRRIAAELQSRRRLEEIAQFNGSAIVGALSAAIGHELNQPLGAILANTEAAELLITMDPPDLQAIEAILCDIRRDDLRAAEVIGRLRALMRRSEFVPEVIDVNDVIREMLQVLAPESAARGVVLNGDLDPRTLLVRADPVHLQQVILNLALNGMDAMSNCALDKRRIGLRTALLPASMVEVSISDSGAGIPNGKLSDIFEPFFTTKRHGMGLGLSISRTIIETFGGKIWAENHPGGGAIFRFRLPHARRVQHDVFGPRYIHRR